MNGKRMSPDQLNELRHEAVKLRLEHKKLKDIRDLTGLSIPTIISAYKRFLAGGWHAIDTRERGAPTGLKTAKGITTANEQWFAETIKTTPPDALLESHTLWTLKSLNEWLNQTSQMTLSARTVARYATQWGFNPPDLLKQISPEEIDAALEQAKQHKAQVFIGGISSIKPPDQERFIESGNFIYARDLRGRIYWLATPQTVDTSFIIDFFRRLIEPMNKRVVFLFKSPELTPYPDIQAWLDHHRDDFQLLHVRGAHQEALPPSATSSQTHQTSLRNAMTLTHLQRLEAESMQIMREVVAESDNPVMLYSIGKDSAVMLHLALKAFYPAPPPFPLLHVDTTWKFREMYKFRDQMAEKTGMKLLVHINPDGLEKGINPFTHGSAIHTDIMKTESLKQALNKYGFDAAFGGARRDEEKSRAKERVFSFRTAQHRWDPKNQRPELWKLYNTRKHKGESIRIFPLSNWTELDIWQYIHLESIPIVPLYYAAERPVVERDGTLIMVDDQRMPLKPGEVPMLKKVRFRTLGCYPLTGAVESNAETLPAIIQEMLLTKTSERQGRMIDHDSSASMEKKKQEGYF